MTIESATEQDLAVILAWLAAEAASGNQTFHGNRGMLAQGQAEDNLYVLRDAADIVAFALGDVGSILIQETRPDKRGRGYGRTLAQWGIERARAADIAVIEGECSPEDSLGFWTTMGFREMRPRWGSNPWVYLSVDKAFTLPAGTSVEVTIRVFDESRLYYNNIPISSEHRPSAVRTADGIIHLADRVVIFAPYLEMGHDVGVEIVVDGALFFIGKAKRSEAAALGVKSDNGGDFYIDRVLSVPA